MCMVTLARFLCSWLGWNVDRPIRFLAIICTCDDELLRSLCCNRLVELIWWNPQGCSRGGRKARLFGAPSEAEERGTELFEHS